MLAILIFIILQQKRQKSDLQYNNEKLKSDLQDENKKLKSDLQDENEKLKKKIQDLNVQTLEFKRDNLNEMASLRASIMSDIKEKQRGEISDHVNNVKTFLENQLNREIKRLELKIGEGQMDS